MWELEIFFAFVKQVAWMNYQSSNFLDVAACGVSGHFVCVQVRSVEFNFRTQCVWSSIDLDVDLRCRNKFAEIALRYKHILHKCMDFKYSFAWYLGMEVA
jgi:hypothetical protein